MSKILDKIFEYIDNIKLFIYTKYYRLLSSIIYFIIIPYIFGILYPIVENYASDNNETIYNYITYSYTLTLISILFLYFIYINIGTIMIKLFHNVLINNILIGFIKFIYAIITIIFKCLGLLSFGTNYNINITSVEEQNNNLYLIETNVKLTDNLFNNPDLEKQEPPKIIMVNEFNEVISN